MKKVIYVIIVLTGIVTIGSNFVVNTSNIDHKNVSASSTTCRWISDTGYGVGPYYTEATSTVTTNIASNGTHTITYNTNFNADNIFSILPCNPDGQRDTNKKNGNLLYASDGNTYNGYLRLYSNEHLESEYYKIEDGLVVKHCTGTSCGSEGTYTNLDNTSGSQWLLDFTRFVVAYMYGYPEQYSHYPTNEDGQLLFTCVCAEY